MTKKEYPSDFAERFQVRMPEGLRERIRVAAESNNRSMNSEIVLRLERSFDLGEAEFTNEQLMRTLLERLQELTGRKPPASTPESR